MSQRERQKESERAREGARETTRKNKGKPEIAFSFKVTYLLQICLFVANCRKNVNYGTFCRKNSGICAKSKVSGLGVGGTMAHCCIATYSKV